MGVPVPASRDPFSLFVVLVSWYPICAYCITVMVCTYLNFPPSTLKVMTVRRPLKTQKHTNHADRLINHVLPICQTDATRHANIARVRRGSIARVRASFQPITWRPPRHDDGLVGKVVKVSARWVAFSTYQWLPVVEGVFRRNITGMRRGWRKMEGEHAGISSRLYRVVFREYNLAAWPSITAQFSLDAQLHVPVALNSQSPASVTSESTLAILGLAVVTVPCCWPWWPRGFASQSRTGAARP